MMTHFGRYDPLVFSLVAADDGGITAFDEGLDVMGSNLGRSRMRQLKGTTFAGLGATCAAGIGFSAVKARGRLPIEMLIFRSEGLRSATHQEQNDSLPVWMTLAVLALNCDMDRVRSFFPPASCYPAI
jgi:hypothetical protein